jgi:hypothetical protein
MLRLAGMPDPARGLAVHKLCVLQKSTRQLDVTDLLQAIACSAVAESSFSASGDSRTTNVVRRDAGSTVKRRVNAFMSLDFLPHISHQ